MFSMRLLVSSLALCFCLLNANPLTADQAQPGQYLNKFLVEVEEGHSIHDVAQHHGFVVADEQHLIELGFYHLVHPEVQHRSKRSAENHVNKLKSDHRVKSVDQQIVLDRVKREIVFDKQEELPVREVVDPSQYYRVPEHKLIKKRKLINGPDENKMDYNDPFYPDSWYLDNFGQTGGMFGLDLRVVKPWQMGFTGKDKRVLVLDDGVDHSHPDLIDNYDREISIDFNGGDDDPMPNRSNSENSHGTKCAGEIAAKANNNECSVGVANEAKIGGLRILDGAVDDAMEARALNHKMDLVDVYSASWGPRDDGQTMDGPHKAAKKALERGAKEGRGGLGSLFVWATGNGGQFGDSCGADSYVSSIYTISIGSLNEDGNTPYFMEFCSSTMGVVAAGGEKYTGEDADKTRSNHTKIIKVVTTDINGGCVENFQGTSAAAPLASGMMALVLEANPNLTWRDVQHIIAATARLPKVDSDKWSVNAAGIHTSNDLGFGLLDATVMVYTAQKWGRIPEQHTCESPTITVKTAIKSNKCVEQEITLSDCQSDPNRRINFLEHVLLNVNLDHSKRGNIELFMEGPSGTTSQLLFRRKKDRSRDGIDFTFSSVHFWGEDPEGSWKVRVCDNSVDDYRGSEGMLKSISVIWYGIALTKQTRSPLTKPFKPSVEKQKDIISDETKVYKNAKIVKRDESIAAAEQKSDLRSKSKNGELSKVELSALLDQVRKDLHERGYRQDHIDKAKEQGKAKLHSNEKRKFNPNQIDSPESEFEDIVGDLIDEIEDILKKREDNERQKRVDEYLYSNRWGNPDSYKRKFVDLLEELTENLD